MQRYPGSKAADGVYHRIIGLMPPHEVYVEPFVGSGAILRRKKPARASIVIDRDGDVAAYWRRQAIAGVTVIHGDALRVLLDVEWTPRHLIYADPPYVVAARRSALPLYRHELTEAQHAELLVILKCLPCPVLLSGYRCPLYDRELGHWRRFDFLAATHQGPAVESVWFNFELQALHDWRYLGANFRERERIKRKQSRWRRRLSAMPAMERAAMLDALLELASAGEARGIPSPDAAGLEQGGMTPNDRSAETSAAWLQPGR